MVRPAVDSYPRQPGANVLKRRPNTFIIGAPKSGTTSLYGYLREHPDVFMSREKEPDYFAPDVVRMRRGSPFSYPDDEQRYLSLFAGARQEARVGEASTSYLASHRAPSLIRQFDPQASILVMLRNPVDLVYSLYGHRRTHGTEWITDFSEAMEADVDRRAGRRVQQGKAGVGAAYRDYAHLGEQLDRWFTEFGRDRIHSIVFDDFVADTSVEYRRLLRFLGVDERHRPTTFAVHNQRHRPRGGLVGMLFRNRGMRWMTRTAAPRLLGDQATARLANRLSRRRFTRQPAQQVPMALAARQALEGEFGPDVERLGQLIGRDLVSLWFGKGQP